MFAQNEIDKKLNRRTLGCSEPREPSNLCNSYLANSADHTRRVEHSVYASRCVCMPTCGARRDVGPDWIQMFVPIRCAVGNRHHRCQQKYSPSRNCEINRRGPLSADSIPWRRACVVMGGTEEATPNHAADLSARSHCLGCLKHLEIQPAQKHGDCYTNVLPTNL